MTAMSLQIGTTKVVLPRGRLYKTSSVHGVLSYDCQTTNTTAAYKTPKYLEAHGESIATDDIYKHRVSMAMEFKTGKGKCGSPD